MLPLHQPPKVPCLNLLATPQFYNPKCFDENGRGGGIRTPDLMIQENLKPLLKPPQFYNHQRYEFLVFDLTQDIHIAIEK